MALTVNVDSVYVRGQGERHLVTAMAVHSATHQRLVLHHLVTDDPGVPIRWATPIEDFTEEFKLEQVESAKGEQ